MEAFVCPAEVPQITKLIVAPWAALIQLMACRLFSTKPSPQSMLTYCQLNPQEHITMKFYLKFKYFHSRKRIWKWRLQNGGHFVQATMYWAAAEQISDKLWCPHSDSSGIFYSDHFVYATSQWEVTLHCNVASHWPGAYTKWFLILLGQYANQSYQNPIITTEAIIKKP